MMIDLSAELSKALRDPSVAEALAPFLERAVARALEKRESDGLMTSEQVAAALGYVNADGTPKLDAFRAFRDRHPELGEIGQKIGKRWYWRRSVFQRWLDEHPAEGQKALRKARQNRS